MREKTVTIDGIKVGFKTSAAIPVLYNQEFPEKDFFVSMAMIETAYTSQNDTEIYKAIIMVQEMAYVFAKHYCNHHKEEFNFTYIEWLSQFETFSVLDLVNEIMELWKDEAATKSEPKKKQKKQTGK